MNTERSKTTFVTVFSVSQCNRLSTKLYLSDLKTHFVPRSKHSLLPIVCTLGFVRHNTTQYFII
jgi:hypothetical protein